MKRKGALHLSEHLDALTPGEDSINIGMKIRWDTGKYHKAGDYIS